MIKSDAWIRQHAALLGVQPECINPISVDVTLGSHVIQLEPRRRFTSLDPLADLPETYLQSFAPVVKEYTIRPGGAFTFLPGEHYYLAHTAEDIALPDDVAAFVFLKSTSARLGVDHALAGVIEPGFHGQVTLELTFRLPHRFALGSRLAQLVLMDAHGVETPYRDVGRYLNQQGATMAREGKTPQVIAPPLLQDKLGTRGLSFAERLLLPGEDQ